MSTFEITEGLAAIRDHFSPEYNVSYSESNGKLEIKRTDYHWVDVSHTLDVNTNIYHIEPVGCAANDYCVDLCEDTFYIDGHPYTTIIAHITQCLTYGVTCQGSYTSDMALQMMRKGYVMGNGYCTEAFFDTSWQTGHIAEFESIRDRVESVAQFTKKRAFQRTIHGMGKDKCWYIARTPEKRFD